MSLNRVFLLYVDPEVFNVVLKKRMESLLKIMKKTRAHRPFVEENYKEIPLAHMFQCVAGIRASKDPIAEANNVLVSYSLYERGNFNLHGQQEHLSYDLEHKLGEIYDTCSSVRFIKRKRIFPELEERNNEHRCKVGIKGLLTCSMIYIAGTQGQSGINPRYLQAIASTSEEVISSLKL